MSDINKEKSPINNEFHEECQSQWKVSVEDLRFAKRQQWLIGFYGFLIQAAILNFIHFFLIDGIILTDNEKWIFSIASIIAFLISIMLLVKYQNVKITCRKVIRTVEKEFSKQFQHLFSKYYPDNYLSFWYESLIFFIIIFGLFISMSSILWYLFKI